MKKYLLSIFALLLPLLNFAQEAQEVGIDQKIDEAFGSATGWFVNFIFYQIDFGGGVKVFWVLFPLIIGYSFKSLIYDRHYSWYSWFITTLTACVYTFGFVLMCPQLYINHQLKSVSHLPWNYLIYKFFNTFIDDLFAFVIKMPLMHKISVFRDDIIFCIYLWQRWKYNVDKGRPMEK